MGYKLRREVRDALPPGVLTAAERLLVLELADVCGDDTREGWPGAAKLAALTDLSERSIQETLARIGRKWVELRVQLGEKDGRPIYAYAGKRTTFRFPPLAPKGATDTGSLGATDPGASEQKGATDPGERCDGSVPKVRQIRGPSPSRISLKDNPSSLSPSADEADASPIPAQPTEREIEGASQQPNNHNPVDGLLLDAGCPHHQLDDVREELTRRFEPKSNAWWRTVAKSGDLPALVGDVVETLQPMTPALTAEHHADAHPFQPKSDGSPDCKHCLFPAANGRHKVGNQGGGYVSPRVNLVNDNSRRSTSVVRAEQALRVGAQLDAEANGAWIGPSRYHHLTDSRHPGRDYREPL